MNGLQQLSFILYEKKIEKIFIFKLKIKKNTAYKKKKQMALINFS